MVEIGLIICSFVIASKFKAAGEKGASKYILGIVGALIGGMVIGGAVLAAMGGQSPAPIFFFMILGYVVAVIIAILGIQKGNFYLRNKENARADKTAREFEDLKREMEELKKASASRMADS